MKSTNPSKLNSQIYAEASDWLVEFRTGDVGVDARGTFNAWLRTSPEHMRAYLELAAIWYEGPRLDPNRQFDADELADQAQTNVIALDVMSDLRGQIAAADIEHLDSLRSREGKADLLPPLEPQSAAVHGVRRGRLALRLVASAACLLLAISFALVYSERNTYSTGIAEQRWVALEDGSSINLSAQSKVRVRFTAAARSIELIDGQALFQVAKDKARPFVVQSDDVKIRAVGTEFDVYRKKTGTTVTVLEGSVAVLPVIPAPRIPPADSVAVTAGSAAGENFSSHSPAPGASAPFTKHAASVEGRMPAGGAPDFSTSPEQHERTKGSAQHGGPVPNPGEFLLAAGEQAILTAQSTVKPSQPNIAAATAWTQRRFVFESATLAEVAEEFNRYNHHALVIQSPELYDFHITGVFASTDPASLIRFLQARPSIVVTEQDGDILIARRL